MDFFQLTPPPAAIEPGLAGRRIMLAAPGHTFEYGATLGVFNASLGHNTILLINSGTGWDDFNACWCQALNAYEAGKCDDFAMLHADIAPEPGWLDKLVAERLRRQVDLISAISPIKDNRGVTSSGIGATQNPWSSHRRFTMRELDRMPRTFDAAEAGYEQPDRYLLHNTGCWTCDLHQPKFRETDDAGALKAFFDFPRRVRRNALTQRWENVCESEDWYFSRRIHELGISSVITRDVLLEHIGKYAFSNRGAWGNYEFDQDTASNWLAELKPGGPRWAWNAETRQFDLTPA